MTLGNMRACFRRSRQITGQQMYLVPIARFRLEIAMSLLASKCSLLSQTRDRSRRFLQGLCRDGAPASARSCSEHWPATMGVRPRKENGVGSNARSHINFWQQKTHKNNFRELMHSPCSRKWAFAICASQGPLDLLLDGEGNAD